METIQVSAPSKEYEVFIGENVIDELLPFINKNYSDCTKLVILTDETVASYHLQTLLNSLNDINVEVVTFQVPSGEAAKTFSVYEQCLSFALENKLDRKSLLLAFGGGAVGDLGGFVAATFMRGIRFIQVPTTILAHDSAVGGKVAINHHLGKNMVGSFYHPEAVFYHLQFLKTLPDKEIRSGFAEVIKHALIHDISFLQKLMKDVSSLHDLNTDTLQFFLMEGIKVKAAIVAEDEKEQGVRAFLNFGHTLAHAIEAEAGYGKITHGEAVIIGMVFALQLSIEGEGLSFNLDEFKKWLTKLGYNIFLGEDLLVDKLLARMEQDKKSIGQQIRFVLLKKIGEPVVRQIDNEYLLSKLTQFSHRG